MDFKASILKQCDQRNDKQAEEVCLRLVGATADLPAADGQYHKDCHIAFFRTAYSDVPSTADEDNDIETLVSRIKNCPCHLWTAVELQNELSDISGLTAEDISKRPLMSKLLAKLGSEFLEMKMKGSASLWCLKSHLPEIMKRNNESHSSDLLDNVVNKIIKETKSLPKQEDYDLGMFTYNKTVENTSITLLGLVTKLVSGGKVNRHSLSLTQSIQGHITNQNNQTTLGLAIKLHHKFGSKDLLDILYAYGYTCTYDEVKRFRKSVAKYTGEREYTSRGLDPDGRLIGAWFDNYDLNVTTPNGQRETHAMAVEWRQQAREDVSCNDGDYVVPRLSKEEMKSVKLSEISNVPMLHFQGPKKPNPPNVDVEGAGANVCTPDLDGVARGLKADVEWLTKLVKSDNDDEETCPEWSGYMAAAAREKEEKKKATKYVFGPLIDATPSHPDTVLTTMSLVEEFVKNHGQKYVYIEADMQLYKVAMHIQWSNVL